MITGKRENCDGAKEALQVGGILRENMTWEHCVQKAHNLKLFTYIFHILSQQNLVPITKEVSVPMDYHRFIIGMKGREVQTMMKEFDVNISIPSSDEGSDVIKIYGAPANVERAEKAVEEKVKQLDEQKEERVNCNSEIVIHLDRSSA